MKLNTSVKIKSIGIVVIVAKRSRKRIDFIFRSLPLQFLCNALRTTSATLTFRIRTAGIFSGGKQTVSRASLMQEKNVDDEPFQIVFSVISLSTLFSKSHGTRVSRRDGVARPVHIPSPDRLASLIAAHRCPHKDGDTGRWVVRHTWEECQREIHVLSTHLSHPQADRQVVT
jgi:hypothetical protein